MRKSLFLLSLTLLLALLTACRGPAPEAADGTAGSASTASGTAVRLEVPEDPAVGPATLRIYLLDGSEGVSGAEVEVIGTMTHAGMVPVVAEATETEPGLYVADDFAFDMAGDWILTAEVTLEDGTELDEEAMVTVRQP